MIADIIPSSSQKRLIASWVLFSVSLMRSLNILGLEVTHTTTNIMVIGTNIEPSALITTEEFAKLTPWGKRGYAFLRHPLMLLPGGFFYLAIKPRLALILGIYGFIGHFFTCLQKTPAMSLGEIISSYKSKHWYTKAEFWDLLFNNICVVSSWILLSYWLGAGFFWTVYSITLTFSSAIFIYVFFVQHNFEGSYAHTTEGWDYLRGAIEGSSYLELHPILNWFSANIGYHNIHHLSERIPNYNLELCHNANRHLLLNSKKLRIGDMLGCSKFILWDRSSNSLVSIDSFDDSLQLNNMKILDC